MIGVATDRTSFAALLLSAGMFAIVEREKVKSLIVVHASICEQLRNDTSNIWFVENAVRR